MQDIRAAVSRPSGSQASSVERPGNPRLTHAGNARPLGRNCRPGSTRPGKPRENYPAGSSTSAVTVIWTAASSGMSDTPIARRAWAPRAPNTALKRSDAPLSTWG